MRRSRGNRRKAVRRELPKLPKLPKLRINWRAVLIPPISLAALTALAMSGRVLLDRPVGAVIVEGTFQRVTPIQIEAALAPALEQSFLTLDLDELKNAVAGIDWVDSVRLSRVWPDALRVRVTEHRAAASWGENGLLNTRGELFTEDARYDYAELPKLAGPQGSERRVAALYLGVRGRLADAHLMLESIRMDDRGALEIVLLSGQVIRVGRDDVEARLDRFFAVAAPALKQDFERVDYVDLRYPNGFAVGWRDRNGETARQLAGMDTRG
jgi:cell division protein FtsQ